MSWRRTGSGDLPIAWLWLSSAAMGLACLPLLPLAERVLPPCALHTLTGIPCFACGSSRAVLAMARGDWLGALALNPLASLGIVAGCVGGFVAPGWVALHAPILAVRGSTARWLRIVAWCAIAAQWVYLILVQR